MAAPALAAAFTAAPSPPRLQPERCRSIRAVSRKTGTTSRPVAPMPLPDPAISPRLDRRPPPAPPADKLLDTSKVTPRGARDYVEWSRELVRPDGGPPRWFSPLECAERAEGSPLLLFLPGIDGVGAGLIRHQERLGKIFDIWCLHIPVKDRTPFEGLVAYVERTALSRKFAFPDRPIYLLGESVGACLALAVAARNPDIDTILILANPATSFDKSRLQSLSTLLDAVPEPFQAAIPYFLGFLTGNSMRMSSVYDGDDLSLQEAVQTLSESLSDMLPSLSLLGDIFSKESLLWKIKILKEASSFVNSRLHAVNSQTLVLASEGDELLPSREEADRLCSVLPNCRVRHFKNSGHTILLEGGMDLVTVIKGAGYYRRSRLADYVSDYLSPTINEFQKVAENYRLITLASCPVMLSTLKNGRIVNGLDGIPQEGPAVLVGYHMLMGFDLGPLVLRFFSEKGIHLRGIAHPFIFNRSSEQLMPDSSSFDIYRMMGAVPVTAANFFKLLSRKSFVLLYPGGAREALHRKGEQYKLFWPEQPEFIRMASRFGATIIPFGVVGEDDIWEMLLDYEDLVKVPFYDILDKRINEDAVRLRADVAGEVGKQDLHPPVLLPKIPGRMYFLFGRPIETRGREKELRDREKAQQLYLQAKSEVESCIAYLLEKRKEDPYRNILPRLIYQATHGFTLEVPTFDP